MFGVTMKNRAALMLALGLGSFALAGAVGAQSVLPATEWKDWGGNAARMHYSILSQITVANVSGL
jgi:glucose dehydrogenase